MSGIDPTDDGAEQQAIKRGTHLDHEAVVTTVYPAAETDSPNTTVDLRYITDGGGGGGDTPDEEGVSVTPGVAQGVSPPLVEGTPVIVRWLDGTPPEPYVADTFYNGDDPAPQAAGNEHVLASWGGARIVADADGNVTIEAGDGGEVSVVNSQGAGLTTNGQSADVAGYSGGAGSGTPGELPDTDPSGTPQERAEQAGFDIQNTVQASSTSDITGEDNTIYTWDGSLTWDGPVRVGTPQDVAICGGTDAVIPIPAGFRDEYAIAPTANDGNGLMVSGVDLDQSADGARGRISVAVADRGIVEYHQTVGSGRRTNPTPSQSLGQKSGPWLYPAATSRGGRTRVTNCASVHAGVFADSHFGDRPSGLNMGPVHRGTLTVENSTFRGFSNNGVYCSNVNGTINIHDSEAINCGVSGFRIARGVVEDSLVRYDYTNTDMDNADAPDHGLDGIAIDQDIAGGDVDVRNCSVEMLAVASIAGGIRIREGQAGVFEGVTVQMDDVGGAADVLLSGPCGEIRDSTFGGAATSGTAVVNQTSQAVTVSGNTFNYGGERSNYAGPINQA